MERFMALLERGDYRKTCRSISVLRHRTSGNKLFFSVKSIRKPVIIIKIVTGFLCNFVP